MNNLIEYKGYVGSVEFSESDGVFFGKVQGIRSLISYEGTSATELIVSALSRHGMNILSSKMLALSKLCKHFEWDCQVKAICCA